MSAQPVDLSFARAARDAGMSASLSHAERVNDGWAEIAGAALLVFARTHARFTAYDFRQAYHAAGKPAPPTDKAFGSVFQRAAREGVIERVGYQPHPERHASPTVEWASLICVEAA